MAYGRRRSYSRRRRPMRSRRRSFKRSRRGSTGTRALRIGYRF